MKRVVLLALLLLFSVANAQGRLDDSGRITIHAVVPEYEGLPFEARKLLETKLSQIITLNGIADNDYYVRFVLTAKVNVISKDIVAGPPQRISQKLDITLMLGDIVEDKVYSQHTISALGVGTSEEKAFIAAIKQINANNKEIAQFIHKGKQRIIAYYQTNCENIMAEAKDLAARNQYEQAILLLSSIPDVSSDCFNESVTLTESTYSQMIETRGGELLRKAQNAWAKNPTRQGANEATRYLQQINHAASCQTEVSKLLSQISDKMNEIDRREWEQQMQEYQDNVERERREWEQRVREYNDQVETQRQYISAARDVAIEYARNQPKVINYNSIILW